MISTRDSGNGSKGQTFGKQTHLYPLPVKIMFYTLIYLEFFNIPTWSEIMLKFHIRSGPSVFENFEYLKIFAELGHCIQMRTILFK